jgi:hypothetical protein
MKRYLHGIALLVVAVFLIWFLSPARAQTTDPVFSVSPPAGAASSATAPVAAQQPAMAFDGVVTTKFLGRNLAGNYLTVTFPTKHNLTAYDLVTGNDIPARDPRSWRVWGSNDGQVWDLLDTRVDVTSIPTRLAPRSFNAPVSTAYYSHFKFTMDANWGDALYYQLAEWTLRGRPEDILPPIVTPPPTTTPAPPPTYPQPSACKVPDRKYISFGSIRSDPAVPTSPSDIWAYWWCIDDADGKVMWSWRGFLPEAITAENIAEAIAWTMGLAPEFANKPLTLPPTHPRMVALRAAAAAHANANPDRPLPRVVTWIVAKNSTYADRPTYEVVNNGDGTWTRRTTASALRIPIFTNGTPTQCNTQVHKVEGTSNYLRVSPPAQADVTKTYVALCVKAPT